MRMKSKFAQRFKSNSVPLCKALSFSSSHYKKAYGYFSRKTHHISFSCLTYDFKKPSVFTERSTWIWIFPNGTSLGFCHSVKLLRNQEEERMYIFIRRKNSLAASSSSLSAIWLSIMSSASSSITSRLIAFPWKLLLLCLDTKNYSWKE